MHMQLDASKRHALFPLPKCCLEVRIIRPNARALVNNGLFRIRLFLQIGCAVCQNGADILPIHAIL